ncbi:tetratricopeptide repeat protein [Salibacterium salarium]|uniref:Tetratricopeptide repeat protein n=1 Tax=Salibacterium salarium TaxID=284579 RepID=A0A428N1X7_9BACI|nr:tetratricopeptide repeat protein [Salibacterium salarium]RSL32242.1 tetratricopeptide repeat protein [Salibacterium salarium]
MSDEDEFSNIVPFPGSANKLSKEGLEELKNGDKEKAVFLFSDALAHDNDHEEAAYGLLLAYAETGRLRQGSEWAEKMMEKATGSYFEVLQVYVSLLAQLGEYEKVVLTLEAVQAEERFPARMAEQLFELLELSRNMANAEVEKNPNDENAESSPDIDWKNELKRHHESENKLAVLSEMRQQHPEEVTPVIEEMLSDEECKPLLKTLLLFLLKDWNIEKNVWIEKIDRKGEFLPTSLSAIEESMTYIKVSQLLENSLAHEDPVLFKNALHLLKEILLFYYPFPPSVQMEPLAAVIHAEALNQSGMEVDVLFLCSHYEILEKNFCETKEEYDKLKTKLSEL